MFRNMNVRYVVFVFCFLCASVYCNQSNVSSQAILHTNMTSDIYGTNSSSGGFVPSDLLGKFNPVTFAATVMSESVTIFWPADYPASVSCNKQRLRVMTGLLQQQTWPLQYIDSVGKPPSGVMQGNTVMMGSYDQCVSIYVDDVMRGSFFRLMFKADFPSLQRPIAMGVQETGLPYLYWFICLPSGCSRDDASQIGTAFAKKSNVQLIDTLVLQAKDPTGDVCFIIAVVIFSILGAFCLIGTVVDVYAKCYQKAADDQGNGQAQDVKHDSKPGNDGIVVTGIRVIHDDESGQFSSPTLGQQLLPRRISRLSNAGMSNEVGDTNIDAVDCDDNNTNSRMDNNSNQRERKTSKQKNKYIDILKAKHAPGDIKCLHGIRVVTISWVVIGHSYYMAPQFGNVLTLFEMTKWWSFQGIINAPFAVDTFFMLSGCLVSFLFLRSVQKTGKLTCKHMILYYVHRYLRLTPLYALVILFYTGIAPYLESGPFAKAVHDRDVACRSSWWWNILYISNFVEGADMCLNWSWYLANDMQFYVVAPLALVPIALG